jgi:ABC-type transporter Mla subunit MlaD
MVDLERLTGAIEALAVALDHHAAALVTASERHEKNAATIQTFIEGEGKTTAVDLHQASADVAKVEQTFSAPPATEEQSPPPYDTVAKAVMEFAKANGRPAVLDLLKKFGAGHLKEVKQDDYPALMEALS